MKKLFSKESNFHNLFQKLKIQMKNNIINLSGNFKTLLQYFSKKQYKKMINYLL